MKIRPTVTSCCLLALTLFLIFRDDGAAFQPKRPDTDLSQKKFFRPEFYIGNSSVHYDPASLKTLPNGNALESFLARHGTGFELYFDARSGTPVNIIGRIPLLPGAGAGNQLKLRDVSGKLGRSVNKIDSRTVADLFQMFVTENQSVYGIDLRQMGQIKTTQINDYLWHVHVPQEINGIPVRYGRLTGTINHGNLILSGTENWGNVRIDTTPRIATHDAMRIGFQYAGGKFERDRIWQKPALEIWPFAPPEFANGQAYVGPVGSGYGHRLVWVFGFQRAPQIARWEVAIDAINGEIVSFYDKNHYAAKQITGGVYPLTNTFVCPDNPRCGTMQPDTPMPWADTGFVAPNDFTNSAGLFDYTSGTTTTHLNGLYVRISDNCGAVSESASGDLDLGGTNGETNCVSGGSSPGNSPASRSGFYEVNKIAEAARGYLPLNPWLQQQITANMNIDDACNAFYDFTTINFFKSGSISGLDCRNTGEIAAVFDHEWGHALDDNDSNGQLSNSSEGYADIASMYRLWASCVGYGFFKPNGAGANCGNTIDGTGGNNEEAQQGASHCDTDCSGVRDSDYAKHFDGLPDGAPFICSSCFGGPAPCGTQVHCGATPVRQAAWDLPARDLPTAGFDANTSFIIADKLFYQGSGNISTWHACSCPNTSDGCGATHGYMQWLAADDDNGNPADGTPHMQAIFNAYNRHGIACATPTPQNGGCSGGPTVAPVITVAPGSNQNVLNWGPVANAVSYNVFRGEGFAGCNFGKALIANVNGTTYTDTEVANGRTYSYVVMAVGSSSACFTPASSCVQGTPLPCAGSITLDQTTYSCSDTILINLVDSDLTGNGTQQVSVASTTESLAEVVTLTETPPNSGAFTGSIQTTSNPPLPANGILSVTNADTITATYSDQSFCGPPQPVNATAAADCVSPLISNVQVPVRTESTAQVTWTTNEIANSRVTHAPAPGPPNTNQDDLATFTTSHAVTVTGLNQCSDYVFSVTSTDPAGNSVTDNNSGALYTFTTFGISSLFGPDDAEAGSGNWIVSGGGTSKWHVSTCDAQSGTHAFKAGAVNCASNYGNLVSTSLISANVFDLGPAGHGSRLKFFENYDTEPTFDFCHVQVSTDGGVTYSDIDVYDGNSGGWIAKDYDLSPYGGNNVRIRFLFVSDELVNAEGWFIDDIQVTKPAPCTATLEHFSNGITDDCSAAGIGDGDGNVDPGENVVLQITAKNAGLQDATGVSATLSTTTPGITITDNSATFPTIPALGTVSSDPPHFAFTVDPTAPCGTFIDFTIDYISNEGNFSDNFTVLVGSASFINNTYPSTNVPLPIQDIGNIVSTLVVPTVVPASGLISDLNVTLSINHSWDGDLDISLIAPDGTTTVDLTSDNGASGDHYINTTFDDTAAVAVIDASPPYNGTFKPEGTLSVFNGLDQAGTWTLLIQDDKAFDAGILNSWSLNVTTVAAPVCNTCGASACTFSDSFADNIFDWVVLKLSWIEFGGNLIGTPLGRKASVVAPPAFAGCQNCTITATVSLSGGPNAKAWLLTHRVDSNNQIEVLLKEGQDKIVVKQRIGGVVVRKAKANVTLLPNTAYSVRVVHNGTNIQVFIDGSPVITLVTGAVSSGTVGFETKNNILTVSDICVN